MTLANRRRKVTKKWKMPKWMEPYREQIVNTSGNTVEDMVNGNASPIINLPLSTLQACVKSQVLLLGNLHTNRMLIYIAPYKKEKP